MQAETAPVDPKRRYLCRHIFADGHRCGSPALRQEQFCYYHHVNRRPKPAPGKFRHLDAAEPFDLPIIEDRASALLVTSQILSRIASNDLDVNRASRLIAGLRVAVSLLPRESRTGLGFAIRSALRAGLVEEPVLDETHGPIAPIAEAPVPVAPPRPPAPRDYAGEPCLRSYPQRMHTPEEEEYLDLTIYPVGYCPRHYVRPATLTDEDIIQRVNAERRCYGKPSLTPALDAAGVLLSIHEPTGQSGAQSATLPTLRASASTHDRTRPRHCRRLVTQPNHAREKARLSIHPIELNFTSYGPPSTPPMSGL